MERMFLDWKSTPGVGLQLLDSGPNADPAFKSLKISLDETCRKALLAPYEQILAATLELRLDLPLAPEGGRWTLYLKIRETGQSRAQVAHPQKDEWVATLQLNHAHALALEQALQAKGPQPPVSLGSLGELSPFSNLDVHFEWI